MRIYRTYHLSNRRRAGIAGEAGKDRTDLRMGIIAETMAAQCALEFIDFR